MKRAVRLILLLLLLCSSPAFATDEETNLVANGSFERSRQRAGTPDDWSTAGNPAVQQRLALDAGRDGRPCAKLVCSEFQGDGPDYHAMICQVGKIGARRGQWYRLNLWAKAEGLKAGSVEVGLSDTSHWESVGLSGAFTPGQQWAEYQFVFRARQDLAPRDSRLQFWFKSTGTLWLSDVVLAESAEGQKWFPQIATEGVKNFVPNSSFECGLANWGSYTYGLKSWAGNLYRLEGEADAASARHGRHSLKISLTPTNLPVFYFDYYEPVRQPVRRVLAANQGWFRVQPGESLTLSAWLKADADGVTAQLAAIEAPEHLLRKRVVVGRTWQRYEYTFAPNRPFLFIAVGLDLEGTAAAGTLWLDAIQLERGDHATAYEPRQPVESFLETGVPGNIFTNAKSGLAFTLRAFNDSDRARTVRGRFAVRDFFDRDAFTADRVLKLASHSGGDLELSGLCKNQQGFFRATWELPGAANGTRDSASTQSLRCAVIIPAPGSADAYAEASVRTRGRSAPAPAMDSPFGFNHAYPWDFLVRSARQAGVVWWRDWSAKWQTIEPTPGRFDFREADEQIERVQALDSQVEVLLPFPSASWNTRADAAQVAKAARGNEYLQTRLPVAYAPKDLDDFGRYAAVVARHYLEGRPRPVTHLQILNEPLYTDYALPRSFGYTVADYLRLLEATERAVHGVDARCRVVGGFSAGLDAGLTRDFVTQGGLRLLDVFDLHMYDAARPAEAFEESFAALERLMLAHGGPKPVWITEWGCYADDDPPCVPQSVGDDTMNRCCWPSERAAAEHIVKFAAIAFSHGVRKIFFHAGTCGAINGPDAGGVLFEYGGAPSKMYPAVAAFSRLLGVPDAALSSVHTNGLHACLFRAQGRTVAIAWSEPGQARPLKPAPGVAAYNLMGNPLPHRGRFDLDSSPVYLVGENPEALLAALGGPTR
jgi:hypothetical protein